MYYSNKTFDLQHSQYVVQIVEELSFDYTTILSLHFRNHYLRCYGFKPFEEYNMKDAII
jgi:hypothetical protein